MNNIMNVIDMNKIEPDYKWNKLMYKFGQYLQDGVLIAFSGGVDSAFLLWAAYQAEKKYGGQFAALTTTSPSMPEYDKHDAKKFAENLGITHIWQESQEMNNPNYLKNDEQRCYYCKNELFSIMQKVGLEKGYKWLMYGYNASDTNDFRPGHKAADEFNVLAPLAEAGFSKDEIRKTLKNAGIEIAEKPASPCLSSRIGHGIPVTQGRLADILFFENILRNQDIKICRVRINKTKDGHFIRIEVAKNELEKIINVQDQLNKAGKQRGYKWVTLDLAGYRMGGGTE